MLLALTLAARVLAGSSPVQPDGPFPAYRVAVDVHCSDGVVSHITQVSCNLE